MSITVFSCVGGHVVLPNRNLVLVHREDGGNLIVEPPREVWERSELSASELTLWSFLVSATGRAMIDVLPQLREGCINYWEAGNWALNHDAEPQGLKSAPRHRRVHLHLLGRSRNAADPSWIWGEAPRFPLFKDRFVWASTFERLTALECQTIVANVETSLTTKYGMTALQIASRHNCRGCAYPTTQVVCTECSR